MRLQDIVLEDRFNALIIPKITVTVLANLVAAFRIGFRLWWIKWPGADDVLVGFAAVANTAYVVTYLQLVRYSLKIHADFSLFPIFQKFLFAAIVTYVVANTAVKFSILAQTRRIFVQPGAQRATLIIIVYLALYSTAIFLVCIMTCIPVEKYWHSAMPGRCLDRILIHYVFAIINIFNDVIILITPMIFIKDLQVSRLTKLGITALFACGGL
ncbi:hypothetical protein ACRE_009450 [Hapsidospora chrysogenum ATCC 11550]|uniref:Rhodopsin domain-containing protein n=1 Tax=Hapsidospora chrysogenum (strain ATCC 11550 / CBS 779.69 / DSM 880 / IAM 14645 / JCM 23072 / IMI 49137) TaxID=857340 RepID=A0A086TFU2_HAPC1|nr:hypothetical protein ACRE_009450 [Hapsidospora chrysogenum ATCC 11550]